jgi:hypothetical protein
LDDARRLPATLLGLTPLLAVSLISTALLWGTGYDLPAQVDQLSDLRAAVAWLALVSLLLIVAYPVLGYVVRLLRGDWPRRAVARLFLRWAVERKRRRHLSQLRAAEISGRPVADVSLLYPLHDSPLWPTLLGNVEAALVDRVRRRYGVDLEVAWPRLAALQAEADRASITEAKRRADAAAFVSAGWALATAFLLISVSLLVPSPPLALFLATGAAVGAMLCRTAYREAVIRTVRLGRLDD